MEYLYKVYVWDKKYHTGPIEKLYADQCSGSYEGNTLNDPVILRILSGELDIEDESFDCFFRIHKQGDNGVAQVIAEGETFKTY